jgi:hypothetical protein
MDTALWPAMDFDPRSRQHPARRVSGRRPEPYALKAARTCGLAMRYQAWTGSSGRRYVVSVHARRGLPDFSDAVLLAVAVDEAGGLTLLGARASDDGVEGWPALAAADEVHVHLLARRPEDRARVVADLRGGGGRD